MDHKSLRGLQEKCGKLTTLVRLRAERVDSDCIA